MLRIKEWREHCRLTQSQLATMLGVEKSTVSRYENGRDVKTEVAAKIAAALGITPAQLATLPPAPEVTHPLVRIAKGAGALPAEPLPATVGVGGHLKAIADLVAGGFHETAAGVADSLAKHLRDLAKPGAKQAPPTDD